jgi:hypothetical protein
VQLLDWTILSRSRNFRSGIPVTRNFISSRIPSRIGTWLPHFRKIFKNKELACIAHKSKERYTVATDTNSSSYLQIAQPSPVSMPALEHHVRSAGEVKNQQNNEPHQVNERQTVAVTGGTRLENKTPMPEPRDGLMK